LNPCNSGLDQCGRGAECFVQAHRANCICPSGTQGDPYTSCITGVCQYNDDCADHEACDRLNRLCRPVCDDQTCAITAQCTGKNHQPSCNCRPGTSGNPYIECTPYRDDQPKPECTADSDCPSKLTCINRRCADPCQQSDICFRDQTCFVVDTYPMRTVMCKCPPDTAPDSSGICRRINVREQCQVNKDCPDSDQCLRGVCTLACRVEKCGINAQCLSQRHRAICSCPPGYEGSPHQECTVIASRIPSRVECDSDDQCPFDRTCLNERCVNPCGQSDSCGRGALCYTESHKAVCKCPIGYTGNAAIKCIPRKYCKLKYIVCIKLN
jgi:hypothetical protein